jgi:uncharacterized SAM-binding protein YcdF (DUF218 family)
VGIRRIGRLLGWLVRAGLALWAVTASVVLVVQLAWPRDLAVPAPADAIFCLGAGMADEDSPLPDASSAGRARTCAALHGAGAAPVVVFTGYGTEVGSAAQAMADLAATLGVPEAAMRLDPAAQSTLQNAHFGLALLDTSPERVIVVSDAFHLPRSWVIFRVLGVPDVALRPTLGAATPPLPTMLRWSAREGVALWFNVARLGVYGIAGALGVDRETRIGWFN